MERRGIVLKFPSSTQFALMQSVSTLSPALRRSSAPWLRPVMAGGGALLVGAITLPFWVKTPVSPGQQGEPIVWEVALPRSSTARVVRSAPPGQFLRGKIQLQTNAVGKAPVGGAVARWVVEPGARVVAGEPVIEISSGSASRAVPRAEASQTRAERAQVEASNGQMRLAQNLAVAQSQMRGAGERVQRAQKRVGETRVLVKRLLNGEKIARSEVGLAQKRPATPSRANPALVALQNARRKADIAQQMASAATQSLDNAQAEVESARLAVKSAEKKADAAKTQVGTVEAKFDAKTATAEDVLAARSNVEDAQEVLTSAQARLDLAQKDLPVREKDVAQRAAQAKTAQIAVEQAAKNLESAPASQNQETGADDSFLSAEEAAKMVSDALGESHTAARNAERLQAQVNKYQRQANASKTQIESATQQLQSAQQGVLDSAPRPTFTAATAPSSGVVTWISRLAREVGAGDGVFGLSSGQSKKMVFEDDGESWKKMKVGQTLTAFSRPAPAQIPANGSQAALAIPIANPTTPEISSGTPLQVKITRIAPPENETKAVIEGEIVLASNQLSPDAPIFAAVAGVGKGSTLTIPTAALLQKTDAVWVAVLEESAQAQPDSALELNWVKVVAGRNDGVSCEIKSGLEEGDQIVTDPLALAAGAAPESAELPRVKLDES